MARPVKKLEYRDCKLCNKEVHYKLYRKVADFYEKLFENSDNKH